MSLYKICFILSLILVCFPGSSYAGESQCTLGELTFVSNQNTKSSHQNNLRYRLNDLLKIKATGSNCIAAVRSSFKPNAKKPQLYFDGILMRDIQAFLLPVESPDGKHLTLNMHLQRMPDNKDNKKSWDTYLNQQNSGFIMHPIIGLSLSDDLPVLIVPPATNSNGKKFEFYIAEKSKVYWTTAFGLLLFFVVFYLLIKNPAALRDKNSVVYSLGKSQMAFWGLLVLISFSSIWFFTETIENIPVQIFYLMGISGATGLGSIVIGENKKVGNNKKNNCEIQALLEERTLLNTLKKDFLNDIPEILTTRLDQLATLTNAQSAPKQAPQSNGFFRDICNGGEGIAFHRLQAALWTIVLGVVFIVTITTKISMPEFPENLLYLLGISNLTYIGFKIPEKVAKSAST